jgi:O-methyltransferase
MKNLDKHPKLKYFLKAVYYLIFRRKLYGAHKNYTFSDEKLKFTHILEAVNYIRVAGLPYNYYEFGCHSARTFSAAASAFKYLKMNQFELYAFDSFEGLPDTIKDKDGYFQGGTFSTSISDFLYLVKRQSGLILNPENCIKGYYENSLTQELQSKMPKAGIVHIDVDLYSSTVEVLEFIKPLMVVGTVLIFDDWYCFSPGESKGEKRAFEEFCIDYPKFKTEKWKNYSTFGKSFFVTNLP